MSSRDPESPRNGNSTMSRSPNAARTPGNRYNWSVRIISAVLLTLCLAACNRGIQNKDAVRQGIEDHLKARNIPVEVSVTSVTFKGNRADAVVLVTPKGGNASQGMTMPYQLEQQGNKWVVVGRESGANPHGGAMPMPGAGAPGGAMPGGGMPAAQNPHGGGQMPPPENLPPASKKQ